jgi:hypothetical protein
MDSGLLVTNTVDYYEPSSVTAAASFILLVQIFGLFSADFATFELFLNFWVEFWFLFHWFFLSFLQSFYFQNKIFVKWLIFDFLNKLLNATLKVEQPIVLDIGRILAYVTNFRLVRKNLPETKHDWAQYCETFWA